MGITGEARGLRPLSAQMTFKRFVEVGRVAIICYGPDAGKLCTIVNILDHNRVLVDGPMPITSVHRHEIGVKRIMLTDLKVTIPINASQKKLVKIWGKRTPWLNGNRRAGRRSCARESSGQQRPILSASRSCSRARSVRLPAVRLVPNFMLEQ